MRFRLDCAAEWYWLAETPDQARCAYYEMLLAGGEDGYACGPRWRIVLARWLRRVANRIDP